MSDNLRQETASNKKPITRKAALGIVHQFFMDYAYVPPAYETPEQREQRYALRQRAWDAFDVLARAIHGPCDVTQYGNLCDICHIRYSQHFPQVKVEVIKHRLVFCCTPCLEQLRAEGQLYEEKSEDARESIP
jgi:hypothetical protein